MTKKQALAVLVVVVLLVVAIGAQVWTGDEDPGAPQTDRDTVMDQVPTDPRALPNPRPGTGSMRHESCHPQPLRLVPSLRGLSERKVPSEP